MNNQEEYRNSLYEIPSITKLFNNPDLGKTKALKNTKVSISNFVYNWGIIKGVFKYGAWVQVEFTRTKEFCVFIRWRDLNPHIES